MSERLWEYGDYWIGTEGNSDNLYAYWYNKRKRKVARRSLGTKVLSEAQDKLIELVGTLQADSGRAPERVMMLAALDHYYENDVKAKPSGEQAFRAISIIREFLSEKMLPTANVASFGPIRQREFMQWSQEKFGHSPAYIARNLSVVSAAFQIGKKLLVVRDGLGNEHEVQLLDSAPEVITQAKQVAELLNVPEPKPRDWLPTFDEFGHFIDMIGKRQENLFRFVILSLNTWARPDTIIDFRDTEDRVNRRFGVLDLNPTGRRQTNKYRPKIRLTENLLGWLDRWKAEEEAEEAKRTADAIGAPMLWNGQPVTTMKRTFKRHAEECGLPQFTQGTIRHFMATMVRREKPRVDKEQRDVWLGHDEARTADAYEAFDPEYLSDAMHATDSVIEKLQKCTRRPLFAPKVHPSEQTEKEADRGGFAENP